MWVSESRKATVGIMLSDQLAEYPYARRAVSVLTTACLVRMVLAR